MVHILTAILPKGKSLNRRFIHIKIPVKFQVLIVDVNNSALLMLVGQFADGISTVILGLIADKIGKINILRWE